MDDVSSLIAQGVLSRREVLEARAEPDLWARLESLLTAIDDDREDERYRGAVAANLVAVMLDETPADLDVLHALASQLGERRLAASQVAALHSLGETGSGGLTTLAVRRMMGAAMKAPKRSRSRSLPMRAAVNLLLASLGSPSAHRPSISTVEELRDVVHGDANTWWHHLEQFTAHPWGPYPDSLVVLAEGDPWLKEVVATVLAVSRELVEEIEDLAVQMEVRRLVTSAGVTPRRLASMAGLRLSTLKSFMSGDEVPPATVMVRLQSLCGGLRLARSAPRANNVTPLSAHSAPDDASFFGVEERRLRDLAFGHRLQ